MSSHLSVNPDRLSPEQAALIDEACDRFEGVLKTRGRPAIEQFLNATAAAIRPALFRELLGLELYYLRLRGESVQRDAYLAPSRSTRAWSRPRCRQRPLTNASRPPCRLASGPSLLARGNCRNSSADIG